MRIVLTVLALAMLASTALSQQPCGPKVDIIKHITGAQFHEIGFIELGMPDGSVMQLYSNLMTGTWTLLIYPQPGVACMVATGKSMEPMNGHIVKPKGASL